MAQLALKVELKERGVNEGFSGGEKKRNELLQMLFLEPSLSILDEIDSGLDIDSLRIAAEAIRSFIEQERSVCLITHYQRIFHYLAPHFVHVISGGRIVRSGSASLAEEIEQKGYEWIVKKPFPG